MASSEANYDRAKLLKSSLNLMCNRLGSFYRYDITEKPSDEESTAATPMLDPSIIGTNNQQTILDYNGGTVQQERMIFDKRRSLDKAVLYSYQGAFVKNIKAADTDRPIKALINPNKNKVDYDDKIISVNYEYGMGVGDVFEWMGTKTYWLIYLQDLTELAYFRGDIRRCSYEISWLDENGKEKSTYAAVRGPVETKIDYAQKHQISIDSPNYSLHILMPRNSDTLSYFKRYSKFYLTGADEDSPQVCWRVEATDWISTPGILEITAVEYFINQDEDEPDKGLVGSLIAKEVNPNTTTVENTIVGETFIKPKITYTYQYKGDLLPSNTKWILDKKYPVEITVDASDRTKLTLKWTSSYSGQMVLSYGDYSKTIVVQSLF